MTSNGKTSQELAAELAATFEQDAERIDVPGGIVYISTRSSTDLLGLDTLQQEWFAEGAEEAEDRDLFMAAVGAEDEQLLVEYMTDGGGAPMSWYWNIKSFRLGDRGYIVPSLSDIESEPAEPVLAAWEPYDNQEAFEQAFVEMYCRHDDPLGVGGTHVRGARVSPDVLRDALLAAARNDGYTSAGLQEFAESASGEKDWERVVDQYLQETERERV